MRQVEEIDELVPEMNILLVDEEIKKRSLKEDVSIVEYTNWHSADKLTIDVEKTDIHIVNQQDN